MKLVIFGATSAIAMATARRYAEEKAVMLLVGRDEDKLGDLRNDLLTRGAREVYSYSADLSVVDQHEKMLEQLDSILPDFNAVLIAYGTLSDQELCEQDFSEAAKELNTNFISAASLVARIANRFEARNDSAQCKIAVITSVAGDRGRKSNYIYGTAKGALTLFLQGVRNRLSASGVQVLTIKPGFVATPMTADIEQGPLFASADVVGKGIHKAMESGKDVVYLPFFWWGIMFIIKSIPEKIFKKLSI